MTKIRTVKPELFRHEELFNAEKFSQLPLRLAFIGLFTCCDREGRFRWKHKQLKLDILPYDDIDMEAVLDALAAYGFIVKYQVDRELYGCIPSWSKHQHINIREANSLLPDVGKGATIFLASTPENIEDTSEISQNFTSKPCRCMHVQGHAEKITASITQTSSVESISEKISSDVQTQMRLLSDNHVETLINTTKNTTKDNAPSQSFFCAGGARTCMHMGKWKGKGRGRGSGTELEKEGECKGEGKTNLTHGAPVTESPSLEPPLASLPVSNPVASQMRPSTKFDPVHQIFSHWQSVMEHPHAKMDAKRHKAIRKALRAGYTTQQLCDAISGCRLTPHNMGVNSNSQRYDGLQLILRDSDQIDRFIHNLKHPPQLTNQIDQHSHASLTQWVGKKLQQQQQEQDNETN